MVCICAAVCDICSAHFDTGKNRYRGSEFNLSNSNKNSGSCINVLGNGISYKCAGWNPGYWQKELVVSYSFGIGNGGIVVMLL